jgi:hypothetical protein
VLHEVDARGDGIPDAAPPLMEPQPEAYNLREQSRRLIDAARQLKRRAEENIETSVQRLERARNTMQAS